VKAVIDARGLACPLPLVKARQAMMVVEAGERICVLATDPAAPRDFAEWCEVSGHLLVEEREEAGVFVFLLEKVARSPR
jgi:tRNA 2-thiouridine synthesizing protein A